MHIKTTRLTMENTCPGHRDLSAWDLSWWSLHDRGLVSKVRKNGDVPVISLSFKRTLLVYGKGARQSPTNCRHINMYMLSFGFWSNKELVYTADTIQSKSLLFWIEWYLWITSYKCFTKTWHRIIRFCFPVRNRSKGKTVISDMGFADTLSVFIRH